MKIIAIVSTIEFQNRATIEAISRRYNNIEVLVKRSIYRFNEKKTVSNFVKINYIYTFFPEKLKQYAFFKRLELFLSRVLYGRRLACYDVALLTNTHVAYMLPLLKNKKVVSLFVDPYVLMNDGASHDDEVALAKEADVLLCTSKHLAATYCKKYLSIDVEGVYWPNTADLKQWDIDLFENKAINTGRMVCGYAGNMNEITINIDLVDNITKSFPMCQFVFAGNMNFKEPKLLADFKEIMNRVNVDFIGMVPYDEIQKVVAGWDVCLMLDNIYELSKYVHHNKVYQYLALGKVVVATKTHDDYAGLTNAVLEALTISEFISNIKIALLDSRNPVEIDNRVRLAEANSADARAIAFNDILKQRLT